eukprot:gene16193-22357_t
MVESPDAVFFWRPQDEQGWLGQWYRSRFTEVAASGGTAVTYEHAEQYMMHSKGMLFAPYSEVTRSILQAQDPRDCLKLGRLIPNYNDSVWKKHRLDIVTRGKLCASSFQCRARLQRGIFLKFSQNEALKQLLLSTGDAELVEASPSDSIWDVGFDPNKAAANRSKWGLNLLGKALTTVREQLRDTMAGADLPQEILGNPRRNSRSELRVPALVLEPKQGPEPPWESIDDSEGAAARRQWMHTASADFACKRAEVN